MSRSFENSVPGTHLDWIVGREALRHVGEKNDYFDPVGDYAGGITQKKREDRRIEGQRRQDAAVAAEKQRIAAAKLAGEQAQDVAVREQMRAAAGAVGEGDMTRYLGIDYDTLGGTSRSRARTRLLGA